MAYVDRNFLYANRSATAPSVDITKPAASPGPLEPRKPADRSVRVSPEEKISKISP